VQEEHERVGATSAISGWNEEAIGGAMQCAAQKTLFECRLGFSVGQGSREDTDDEQRPHSCNGAAEASHQLVSTRFLSLHTRLPPASADVNRRFPRR
jgi:hypothetical protein